MWYIDQVEQSHEEKCSKLEIVNLTGQPIRSIYVLILKAEYYEGN